MSIGREKVQVCLRAFLDKNSLSTWRSMPPKQKGLARILADPTITT